MESRLPWMEEVPWEEIRRGFGLPGLSYDSPGQLAGSSSNDSRQMMNYTGQGSSSHSSDHTSAGEARSQYSREWEVVWCHERCFKPEAQPFRKKIRVLANMHRADLGSVKKIEKLLLHFQHLEKQVPPVRFQFFGIATDWREAKPCLKILRRTEDIQSGIQLTSVHAQIRPKFLVVFCENELQHKKAIHWAEGQLHCSFPIHCLHVNMTPPDAMCTDDLQGFSELLRTTAAELIQDDAPLIQRPHYIDAYGVATDDLADALMHGVRLSL